MKELRSTERILQARVKSLTNELAVLKRGCSNVLFLVSGYYLRTSFIGVALDHHQLQNTHPQGNPLNLGSDQVVGRDRLHVNLIGLHHQDLIQLRIL